MSTLVFDPHAPSAAPTAAPPVRPGRVAVGLAALAAEQLDARGGDRVAVAVGLAARAADGTRRLAAVAIVPPVRAAARVGRRVPGAAWAVRAGRDRLAGVVAQARRQGREAVAVDRAEALRFLRRALDGSVGWALPQVIDKALPQIRFDVLPVVVEDLSSDPKIRQLVVDQSRGVVGEAVVRVQTTTATADDRVESVLRRLLGRSAAERHAG
jgi:hypothetical protein